MPLSGKRQQPLEDQHAPQPLAAGHRYHELPLHTPQEDQSLTFARQKTVSQLASVPSLGGCGPSPLRKSPSLSLVPQPQGPQSGTELLSEEVCKIEPKPQKPGKYVCDYCGRACAKPSVLKKHIRSHTGERPYPCIPCGFSFKTKSNLYKHRKSHAHSVKAGTVPFSELGSYSANMDQGSLEGEGELYSDAEQSSDTDEDTLTDSLLVDSEEPESVAVKTSHLMAQEQGSTMTPIEDGSSQLKEINASLALAQVSPAIQSSTIKQRLALRLSEKRSSDTDQSLSLPSQSSKGSTDSGYFSRSESAEHQSAPPNTNAKSYQEIMFGKCYRPSPKQMAVVTCRANFSDSTPGEGKGSERGVSRVFTQEKELVESIKINTRSFTREEIKDSQLDPASDAGPLFRSNSMPTSSAACLSMPQGLRGSHSFDERTSPGGMRRLRRQAAFELSVHESHTETENFANVAESPQLAPSGMGGEGLSETVSCTALQKQGLELATRKRRKEKREEEDSVGPYDRRCDLSEERQDLARLYESQQLSRGAGHSVHTQLDRHDMEVLVSPEAIGRKSLGNVISVIQHTNSLNRSQSEPYQSPRQDSICSLQTAKHVEVQERPSRAEIMRHQLSECRLDQSYQMGPKLVRQSNIQVPEIRVTVEPDTPEKVPEVQVKEPEKHVEEFQWPQRSETLSQFPPEKLPPKKKRLRLADIEHSSGESSFESACTSLSRSPSQDSNLSYSSSFSFDREDSFKSVSPGRPDDGGKPLEFLAVPGSGNSLLVLNQRQQHEMRRSSSEQAPCNLRREFPEARSMSFDYGSLSPTSRLRHGGVAGAEQDRSHLVRQESLNMDPEFTHLRLFPQCYGSSALALSASTVLSQPLPGSATGNICPQQPAPSLTVPVRIQTHVPCFGSITYTTVSQILDSHHKNQGVGSTTVSCQPVLGYTRGLPSEPLTVQILDLSLAKLKTGIPLSLTSRTISTTNASSGGASKRVLSPASSLDLFMEVKQQKRVKEEKMFGQIVEELGAVELGNRCITEQRHVSEVGSVGSLGSQEEPLGAHFTSKQHMLTESCDVTDSAMACSPEEPSARPCSLQYASDPPEGAMDTKVKMDTSEQLVHSQDILFSDCKGSKVLPQFPSLGTTTGVSWCYLNFTKPCSSHNAPLSSVYAAWCVNSHDPNPPDLSTSDFLALLRSKQTTDTCAYTMAAMHQPRTGKVVSSLLLWRQRLEQLQRKPELREVDPPCGRRPKDTSCRGKAAKEDWKEREAPPKQAAPTRIKIFEGGYKSNEDYVYVRGRGRGKYICEECGIRCKKPSMLKKHIRTHTDLRPYVCRVCNFAFKTKGNLTKHMKSKAHMKKCLELGVSVSLDDAEIQEFDDLQSKAGGLSAAKHQFSDADDSDGMDEEIDEIDEDEEEDDEYEGDSTPKMGSRSTSPQPCGVVSLSVTATAVIHGCSFIPLPDAELHPQPPCRRTATDRRSVLAVVDNDQRERPQEEDSLNTLSSDQTCFLFDTYPSCLLSPGWESPLREPSPSRLRYPSPRRELSPRGRSSSSPRWDSSPLRPSSPSLVPIQHLSPAAMERPLSPGAEQGGRKEPLARGRQRVVLRAVSPRRGSHQHRGGEKIRHQVKTELVPQPETTEMELDQRSRIPQNLSGPAGSPHQNILSHLPLHSQLQTRSLLPVVPIGGIQLLPCSLLSSSSAQGPSPAPSPQSSDSPGGSSLDGYVRAQDNGEEDSTQPCDSLSPHQDSLENAPHLTINNIKQEENVQTCMKAIASLSITSVDIK
ncbi:human immunodeficiency virus type I enhancer-binding protein 2 homolog [Hypomesus transpacificus]|uniref:human immunodeficiency virus type I enhancer-binding protein 2 homolog n=1 Tax=Hypomesus transpacificus TaxID=137520 RepID=UPI001F075DE1|nr:human immunodeficiency virus type I enhancer-binding protein 2 homolog [Hypomesus transpacificus]XP_046902026.1 human immunodeficiency virus type I enhancer-binding protein 2 homolog [Hypomesus transpacificus]